MKKLLLLSNARLPGGGWLDHVEPLFCDMLGAGRRRILFLPFAAVTISFDAYAAMARKRFAAMGHALTGAHRTTPDSIASFDAVVVDSMAEFDFGATQEDIGRIAIGSDELWRRWDGPERIYMLVRPKTYDAWGATPPRAVYLLGRTGRAVSITNRPPSPSGG